MNQEQAEKFPRLRLFGREVAGNLLGYTGVSLLIGGLAVGGAGILAGAALSGGALYASRQVLDKAYEPRLETEAESPNKSRLSQAARFVGGTALWVVGTGFINGGLFSQGLSAASRALNIGLGGLGLFSGTNLVHKSFDGRRRKLDSLNQSSQQANVAAPAGAAAPNASPPQRVSEVEVSQEDIDYYMEFDKPNAQLAEDVSQNIDELFEDETLTEAERRVQLNEEFAYLTAASSALVRARLATR